MTLLPLVTVTVIVYCDKQFAEWANSSLSQQTFAIFIASLFSLWLLHCIAFYFQDPCPSPPKKLEGRPISLHLPPGAEKPSYATASQSLVCGLFKDDYKLGGLFTGRTIHRATGLSFGTVCRTVWSLLCLIDLPSSPENVLVLGFLPWHYHW